MFKHVKSVGPARVLGPVHYYFFKLHTLSMSLAQMIFLNSESSWDVWYIHLKICDSKICVKIRVGKKMYRNAYNIVWKLKTCVWIMYQTAPQDFHFMAPFGSHFGICISAFCLLFFFFFLGGPTPLALFMEHEQCIKAKLQYWTMFSVVNSNPKIIFFMFSAINFQFSVK